MGFLAGSRAALFMWDQLIGAADGSGAALTDDDVPGPGHEPLDARVIRGSLMQPQSGIMVAALDGTSILAQPFAKLDLDSTHHAWIPLADEQTVTTGDVPAYFEVGPIGAGVPIFVRLRTNTGSVKRVAVNVGG